MFYTATDIWAALYRAYNANGDATMEAEVRREFRKAYYELCRGTSWESFRNQIDYDFDEDADGMWLPANLADFDGVGNDTYEWKKATPNGALKANIQARMWYISEYSKVALTSGADITIADGATTFTGGATITAAMIGEYIRFNGQEGVHKLLSVTTIETPYYGDALTGAGTYEVRPIGTKKIKLVAPSGITDTTAATIYYSALPDQIYDGSQLVELPTSEIVEFATLAKLFGIERNTELQDKANRNLYGSKGRYEGALSRAQAMNPEFIMPTAPNTFGGLPAGFGARGRLGNGGTA